MTPPGHVGRTAFLLGFAGPLPQVAAVVLALLARAAADNRFDALSGPAIVVGTVYPLIILSFLGGMWWGLAMRRERGQGLLVSIAVVPSLAALALSGLFMASNFAWPIGWPVIGIGVAVILTLPVDMALVRSGDAPRGWMALRAPLSLGLGGLTILLAMLVGFPVTQY